MHSNKPKLNRVAKVVASVQVKSKHRISIPQEVRESLDLNESDVLVFLESANKKDKNIYIQKAEIKQI